MSPKTTKKPEEVKEFDAYFDLFGLVERKKD